MYNSGRQGNINININAINQYQYWYQSHCQYQYSIKIFGIDILYQYWYQCQCQYTISLAISICNINITQYSICYNQYSISMSISISIFNININIQYQYQYSISISIFNIQYPIFNIQYAKSILDILYVQLRSPKMFVTTEVAKAICDNWSRQSISVDNSGRQGNFWTSTWGWGTRLLRLGEPGSVAGGTGLPVATATHL
jgi:hypothetical protein